MKLTAEAYRLSRLDEVLAARVADAAVMWVAARQGRTVAAEEDARRRLLEAGEVLARARGAA